MKLEEFAKDKQLSELGLPSAQQIGRAAGKASKFAVGAGKAAAAVTRFMANPTLPGGPVGGQTASPASISNATADAASDVKADLAEKKKQIQDIIKQKEKELMDLRQTMNQIK